MRAKHTMEGLGRAQVSLVPSGDGCILGFSTRTLRNNCLLFDTLYATGYHRLLPRKCQARKTSWCLKGRTRQVLATLSGPNSAPTLPQPSPQNTIHSSLKRKIWSDDNRTRHWVLQLEWVARIRYISRATIREAEASDCIVDGSLVGELNPEVHYTDNFEGMDIVAGAAGGMEVVIVSDDNFNHAQQRTLIYSFSLDSTMLLPSSCMPAISFKAALQSGEPHQNTSSGWQLLLPIIFFLGLLAAAIAYVVHRRRKYMFQQMRGDDDIELQQDSQKGEGRRTAGGGGEDSTASPMLGEGTDGAVGEDEEQPSRS
mmetsp:Transcript_26026/g.62718  ORF Transcript_26026/g.62718 Transcript_26026/m.62718 type:complete len:313 (+) Transcript_26026:707-1645(+)